MEPTDPEPDGLPLVRGGPSYRLELRLGLGHPHAPRRVRKVLLLILVTWVPLLLLSLAAGDAFGGRVAVTLLHDPVIYSRFLFVVPLLVLAELIVEKSLSVQAQYFLESGLLHDRDRPQFNSARREVIRLRDSVFAEAAILVISFVLAFAVRMLSGLGMTETSWRRIGGDHHARRLVVHPGEPADPPVLPATMALGLPPLGEVLVPGVTSRAGADGHPPRPCGRTRIPRLGAGQLRDHPPGSIRGHIGRIRL